jgi:hypothetical protein
VPFSSTPATGDLTFGAGQTTAQIFELALTRFNAVLAMNHPSIQDTVARIGKARALLNLGRYNEAAAAVAGVRTNFVYNVDFSSTTSLPGNGVYYQINSEKRSSSASQEGVNGLEFFNRSVTGNNVPATLDPRVPVNRTGNGLSTTVPHFSQQKYPTRGTAIPLATGLEARLIEAEAQMKAGNFAGTLTILNALRATPPPLGFTLSSTLAPLTDPGTVAGQQQMLFRERAFWLYLTAHRLGDLRRMIRQYNFTQAQVFPIGTPIFGGVYGTDVNLPIPQPEKNNPEFGGTCIDRNA